MPAGYWQIEIRQGETWRRELSWKTVDAATGVETIVDTSTATALMQVRRTADDPDVLLELSTANGRITTGGDPANIILEVPATVTATLDWPEGERAVFDLVLEFVTGVVALLYGPATLRPAVSRAGVGLLSREAIPA